MNNKPVWEPQLSVSHLIEQQETPLSQLLKNNFWHKDFQGILNELFRCPATWKMSSRVMAKMNSTLSQQRYDYIAENEERNIQHINIRLCHPEWLNNACFVGLLHSAAMKLSLIVAVVVLALAQSTVWPSHNHLNFRSEVFLSERLTHWFFFIFTLETHSKPCTRCSWPWTDQSVLWGHEEQNGRAFGQPRSGRPRAVSRVSPTTQLPHTKSRFRHYD